ncbi:MAG: VWA domain-containing protein [Thermoanaerobaculia bacterium]|nr:VWA domain-containing protein [Thermoanaerobaculia bacterium]
MARPKIVTIVDVSGSMNDYNYITPAKADADTFINMFQPGDKFAVLSFNQNAHRVFPTTANLEVFNPPNATAASSAIQALYASGQTNMGEAIEWANALLASEAEPRGEVLLSDGMWNVGKDPLKVLNKNIRIYTIALGNHGQLDLLRKISQETGGFYSFTPDSIGLASIYFDILEYGSVGQVVYNTLRRDMTNQQHFNAVVKLSAGLDSASIAVNWADPSITFGGTTPGNNQIGVVVRDPNFKVQPLTPVYRSYGFVVYTLLNPIPGNWYFDTTYVGTKSANVTAGAIDPDQLSVLAVDAPQHVVPAGESFTVRTRLSHEGNPVAGCTIGTSAEVPSVSMGEAMARYGRELDELTVHEDGPATPESRITQLRQRLLPHVDILPRHRVQPEVRCLGDSEHELTFRTDKPGEYVVRVEAVAPHPRGGELMRTRHVTVTVR